MGAMEHDALSKLFFALPPVQADVLRIVAGDWVHVLDLDSLERVSAEHAAPDLIQRTGDLAWRVRFRKGALAEGEPPWLLVPMEFQSSVDLEMGARVREYVERHLGALRREGAWSWEGEEPLVLPVVVHDGQTRWRRGDGLLHGLPEAAARALAPMQPGRYELLDASAGALEDWPADNRVTAWVRLLRSNAVAELRAALGEGPVGVSRNLATRGSARCCACGHWRCKGPTRPGAARSWRSLRIVKERMRWPVWLR